MWFRVTLAATRGLFVVAFMMTLRGAHAATPAAPDSADTPPAHHIIRPEPHHATAHGKPEAKTPTAAGDKKGHPTSPAVAIPPPAPKPPVATTPPAAPPPAKDVAKDNGEPPPQIPRFAAFKTDDTNMRKGPGQRYPIEWVYKRRDLPVEVEREYDVWRYVRDADGIEGWVHQVTLSDRRTFVITGQEATLRADAKDTADPVAILKDGVIGRIRECDGGSKWCQVQVSGYRGYLRRDQFWGLLPDEVVGPS
jgi:SH3-like domain-containing protein